MQDFIVSTSTSSSRVNSRGFIVFALQPLTNGKFSYKRR